jgi:hypothetical protein
MGATTDLFRCFHTTGFEVQMQWLCPIEQIAIKSRVWGHLASVLLLGDLASSEKHPA